MFERFTDESRHVIVLAEEEARALGHNSVGTEHILLGLIREGKGPVAEALQGLDVTPDAVRAQAVLMAGPCESAPSGHIPFTKRSRTALDLSFKEALKLGHSYIKPEHLLLGLICEGEGVACQILHHLCGNLHIVRRAVIEVLSGQLSGEPAAPEVTIRTIDDITADIDVATFRLRTLVSELSRAVAIKAEQAG